MEQRKLKIKKNCEICGTIFEKWPSYFTKRAGRFCSRKCTLKSKSREWKEHNPMLDIDNSGQNNPMYGKVPKHFNSEGSKRKDGYVRITVDKKRVLKHRLLMEKKLGRKLDVKELVHHIDGNNDNNSLDNLTIVNPSQHINLHRLDLHKGKANKDGVNCNHLQSSLVD